MGGEIIMYAVECDNLYKEYDKTMVLSGVSIKLEENKIYGLLGRNGSGKTTLLNIISGQVYNTSGEIKVFGEKHFLNEEILSSICFVKDRASYMANMKLKKIFSLAADFFENWDEAFKDSLVQKFQLDVNKKYRNLSKGMEAMVGIIVGLASRCRITIFDEAYSGLDAAARQIFYDILLQDYLENPRTIIFSTHLIEEVSNLFEEVIILHEGKLLLQEDMDTINEKSFAITGKKEDVDAATINKNLVKVQQINKSVKAVIFDEITDEEIRAMESKGLDISSVSLQDMFISITENKEIQA